MLRNGLISIVFAIALVSFAMAGGDRMYTQDVAITFATPEAAQAATTLKPTPVLDGKQWALSARWDDNHPGSVTMHDLMAKHGLKGTFYLNESRRNFDQAFVDKLLPGGFSIGGHAQGHPFLNQLNAGEVFYSILANRVQREAQANMPVVSFAFPFGAWDSKDDADVGARSMEAVRRTGYLHIASIQVLRDNPYIKPGEFAGSLLIVPGDNAVDAARFNENLDKLFKFENAYKEFSHNLSLATHPWQTGQAWNDLDKLFAELKGRSDWWICNQNEYAAYEQQVKLTKVERLSVDGATAQYRLTRPLPMELGAIVPLTVEVAGEVVDVKGDAPHTRTSKDGRTLVNLVHNVRQLVPETIDAIENPRNVSSPAGESKEFPGLSAWLHAGDDGKITLTLDNRGTADLSDVYITWRLPLAYEIGIQRAVVANLKPGEKRVETCIAGATSSVAARSAGGRYYVAEIDFRQNTKPGRLFATATVGNVVARPKPAAPAAAATAPVAPAVDMTPFVIPLETNPASAIAFRGNPIGVDGPRVEVRDSYFYVGAERYRAWGVNLCGGANFPSHERAERIAARLEAAGVNTVRLHHMDIEWARFPDSIWDAADPTKLSDEALDRLDYFVDQLARRGIYTNLNLHVSRLHSKHLGLPDSKATGSYDKMVDLFTPQLIEAQKTFARQLLSRVNKYRGRSYADDAAIAFVEINNENSLFMWEWQTKLKNMHPYYAGILRERFNRWLAQRYPTRDALAAAWQPDDANSAAGDVALPAWKLIQNGGAVAKIDAGRIDVQKRGAAAWNIEYCATPTPINAGRFYTLSFRAKADAPRDVVCRVGKTTAPFTVLGLRQNVKLDTTWREYALSFQSPMDEGDASVSFQLGQSDVDVEFADVKLISRPPNGLQADESPAQGSVAFLLDGESRPRLLDRLRFMAELEKAYYDDFRTFLKKDLGSRSLITGSMVYGPLALWAQSDMDFVDTHAYWAHPTFPGGAWSSSKWTIEQKAMTDSPEFNKLTEIASARLAGKPFTITEYSHPAPIDYQAETVPMIAAMAAAQDWDGVWLFSYSGTAADSGGAFINWFEIEANPSKWAFMPAAAALYRDGGIEPLHNEKTYTLAASKNPLDDLLNLQFKYGSSTADALTGEFGFKGPAMSSARVSVSLHGPAQAMQQYASSTTVVDWKHGRFHVKGRGGEVISDTAAGGASTLRTDRAGFAVIAAASLDGQPIEQSRKRLFTVAGKCENTAMGFSADRRTVGTNWGAAPTLIENLSAHLPQRLISGGALHALNPDGTPKAEPIPQNDTTLALPASGQTLWFLYTAPQAP